MEEIVWCLWEIVKDYIDIVLDLEIRKREPMSGCLEIQDT